MTSFLDLSTSAGFAFIGSGVSDRFGEDIAALGDVNGDGRDDFLVGAGVNGAGAAYLVFGGTPFVDPTRITDLVDGQVMVIRPGSVGGAAGSDVAAAGDVNGDGFDDFIIGAPLGDDGGALSGEAYLIFGSDALPSTLTLSSMDPSQGVVLQGEAGSWAGRSVAGVGDIDGDGFHDVLIGAPKAPASYIVFGGTDLPERIDLGTLASGDGVTIPGVSGAELGAAVSAAGDFNNDGTADFLVGDPFGTPAGLRSGRAYVVFGDPDLPDEIELAFLNQVLPPAFGITSASGVILNGGAAYNFAGSSLASAGDVNGDGIDDILVGAWGNDDGGTYAGAAYIVYGGADVPESINLSSLTASQGVKIQGARAGDNLGETVASAGDVNNDGFADVIIGAPGYFLPTGLSSNLGSAYVVFGGAALPGTIDLATLTAAQGLAFSDLADSGHSVGGLGDLNADGYDDFAIAVPGAATGGSSSGQVNIVYGGVDGVGNRAPTALDDAVTVDEGGIVLIDVLDGDIDLDGAIDPATLQITTNPSHGTAMILNGQVRYIPDDGSTETDTFTYTVADKEGRVSNEATVTVDVEPLVKLVANDDEITLTLNVAGEALNGVRPLRPTDENTILTKHGARALVSNDVFEGPGGAFPIGSFSLDFDASDNLDAVLFDLRSRPTFSNGLPLAYIKPLRTGVEQISYTIESDGQTDTATLTINVVENTAPQPSEDEAIAYLGAPLVIPVTVNDDDPDQDSFVPQGLEVVWEPDPDNPIPGLQLVQRDKSVDIGGVSYKFSVPVFVHDPTTPGADFVAGDEIEFEYRLWDGHEMSEEALVTLYVAEKSDVTLFELDGEEYEVHFNRAENQFGVRKVDAPEDVVGLSVAVQLYQAAVQLDLNQEFLTVLNGPQGNMAQYAREMLQSARTLNTEWGLWEDAIGTTADLAVLSIQLLTPLGRKTLQDALDYSAAAAALVETLTHYNRHQDLVSAQFAYVEGLLKQSEELFESFRDTQTYIAQDRMQSGAVVVEDLFEAFEEYREGFTAATAVIDAIPQINIANGQSDWISNTQGDVLASLASRAAKPFVNLAIDLALDFVGGDATDLAFDALAPLNLSVGAYDTLFQALTLAGVQGGKVKTVFDLVKSILTVTDPLNLSDQAMAELEQFIQDATQPRMRSILDKSDEIAQRLAFFEGDGPAEVPGFQTRFLPDDTVRYIADADADGRYDLPDAAVVVAYAPAQGDVVISDFHNDDLLLAEGLDMANADLSVRLGSANLDFDIDGDGTADVTIRLEGDFEGETFVVHQSGADTVVRLARSFEAADAQNITGDSNDNLIRGNVAADVLDGAGGDDTLLGGQGADTLKGAEGRDTASYAEAGAGVSADLGRGQGTAGEAAGDRFEGIENLLGSAFDDTLIGDGTDNLLDAGAGNDVVLGRAGADSILAGTGNDGVRGGAGADTQDGGEGSDWLHYTDSGAAVSVNLNADGTTGLQSASGGDAQGDVISNFERVNATRFDDTLVGNGERNILIGRDGNDSILAGGGDDVSRGGAGADTQDGGDGVDWIQYIDSAAAVSVNLTVDGVTGLQSASGGDAEGDVISNFERVNASAHDDTLTGGALNDALIGRAGDDSIFAGAGNDVVRGGLGADTLDGGDGIDLLLYSGSTTGVEIDLTVDSVTGLQSASGGDAENDEIRNFERVNGSEHDDTLSGNDAANLLIGRAGADSISGGDGDDAIRGGAGADTQDGGDGLDWLQYIDSDLGVTVDLNVDAITGLQSASGGDAEGDVIRNFERVNASSQDDTLIGNAERNVLIGRAGADFISAGEGDDAVRGGAGADTQDGGGGVDWIQYVDSAAGVSVDLNAILGTGQQFAAGGDAEGDVLFNFERVNASEHDDILVGDAGRNVLIGRAGDDSIDGGDGIDVLRGGLGADTQDGGAGLDWLQYVDSAEGVRVDLNADGLTGLQSASGGDAEGDEIRNFERVNASAHEDVLIGDGGDNIFLGLAGDDSILGGAGNDVSRGGQGADTQDGGEGVDWIQYIGSALGVSVDLTADSVTGLQSASGGDAEGDVIRNFERVNASAHDDRLIGNDQNNILVGRDGSDTISGGGGRDVLDGGLDDDLLSGGAGADVFEFGETFGDDTITDFEDGLDLIRAEGLGTGDEFFDALQFQQDGADVRILHAEGAVLVLDALVADFDRGDFAGDPATAPIFA